MNFSSLLSQVKSGKGIDSNNTRVRDSINNNSNSNSNNYGVDSNHLATVQRLKAARLAEREKLKLKNKDNIANISKPRSVPRTKSSGSLNSTNKKNVSANKNKYIYNSNINNNSVNNSQYNKSRSDLNDAKKLKFSQLMNAAQQIKSENLRVGFKFKDARSEQSKMSTKKIEEYRKDSTPSPVTSLNHLSPRLANKSRSVSPSKLSSSSSSPSPSKLISYRDNIDSINNPNKIDKSLPNEKLLKSSTKIQYAQPMPSLASKLEKVKAKNKIKDNDLPPFGFTKSTISSFKERNKNKNKSSKNGKQYQYYSHNDDDDDEDDDELDDFIVDDEEEDDYNNRRSKSSKSDQGYNRDEIWEIFGRKPRHEYVDNVYSDDESDMEATGADIFNEEQKSLYAARREDMEEEAAEAERQRMKRLRRK